MTEDEVEPFVNTVRAAQHLGKPASWLYDNAEREGIPRYPVGRQWRYKLSELDEWLRAQRA